MHSINNACDTKWPHDWRSKSNWIKALKYRAGATWHLELRYNISYSALILHSQSTSMDAVNESTILEKSHGHTIWLSVSPREFRDMVSSKAKTWKRQRNVVKMKDRRCYYWFQRRMGELQLVLFLKKLLAWVYYIDKPSYPNTRLLGGASSYHYSPIQCWGRLLDTAQGEALNPHRLVVLFLGDSMFAIWYHVVPLWHSTRSPAYWWEYATRGLDHVVLSLVGDQRSQSRKTGCDNGESNL